MSLTLLQLEDLILVGALLRLSRLQLIGGCGGLPLCSLKGLSGLLHIGGDLRTLRPEALQLVGPAEDTGAAGYRSAGHGTARVEHLSIQGDNLKAVSILSGHGNGPIHILGNDGAPQKAGKNLLIPGVKSDKGVAHPHKAALPLHPSVPELGGANGRERQESGPARVPALQIGDSGFAVLFTVHHQVLHRASQRNFNSHGAAVGHVDKAGNRTVNPLQLSPLGLPHHQLDRLGVSLIDLFHLGEHMDAGLERVVLHLELHMALPGRLRPLSARVHTERIAVDDVLKGVPVLSGLLQRLLRGLGFGAPLLQALLSGSKLLAYRLIPVHNLLRCGGQRREQRPGLVGRSGLQRLPLPQLFHLPRQRSGGVRCLLCGLLTDCDLRLQADNFCGNVLQPGTTLLDLSGNGSRPSLLGLQLSPKSVGVFQVVLHIGLEHRDGALTFVGVGLPLHHLKADALRLHILLLHLGGIVLCGGIQRLYLRLSLLLLPDGVLVVGEEPHRALADLLQLFQPYRNFQTPKFVPQDEILLRLFRLEAQRLYLKLQLINFIADAHQVLLCALQLSLGLLLAVAVTGDAGGLLKNLPAVGRFD